MNKIVLFIIYAIFSIIISVLAYFGINFREKPTSTQAEVCNALSEITGNFVERNIRPSFMKNPKTKRNLELDCYDPLTKIAVEYDGEQHYKYPNYFHRTKKEFEKQQERDKIKDELCRSNGVKLIRVPYFAIGKNKKESAKNFILLNM